MIDPGTAILIGQGVNALGGLFKPSDPNKRDREESAREFNRNLEQQQEYQRTQNQFQQVGDISDMARRIEQAPARDKALFMLNQRLGMTPGAFRPTDMMNPSSGPSSQGGIDPSVMQSAMQGYHAPDFYGGSHERGSGGVDPRMYAQLMGRLGYANGTIGDVPITRNTYTSGEGGSAGGGGGPAAPGGQGQGIGPGGMPWQIGGAPRGQPPHPTPGAGNPWQIGGAPPAPPTPFGPPAIDPGTVSPSMQMQRFSSPGFMRPGFNQQQPPIGGGRRF